MIPRAAAPPDLRAWLDGVVFEGGFLARYPYYAHALASLEPVADPSVPWMGVSLHQGRYYLHVNVEAVLRAPEHVRGLLLHEVHHVVLGHLAHPKFFDPAHPDLMELAMETSANEHIEEALPSPIVWPHFERLGFAPGQSTMERYALLCASRAEGVEPRLARDSAMVDEHRWTERAAPAGGVEQTRQVIEALREQGEDDAERAPSEARRIAGRTPEQLLAQLVGATDAPEIVLDWRAALRAFVARARAPVHTWSRPSRRFPSRLGEVPGRQYAPRPVLRPSLVVAIDTSLSMSERELAEVARQLVPLSEHARLVIVECDAAIARVYPFRGAIESVKGRGGTDLRPVFAPRFLAAHRADGVVYFTDGDGPLPDAPPAIPVLWVLTKPHDFACPWGDRARLTRDAPATRSSRRR